MLNCFNGRTEAIDDNWGTNISRIELNETAFAPKALAGLDTFSHLEVIFFFDRVLVEKIETGVRHPRNQEDWPLVGVFAQRGQFAEVHNSSLLRKLALNI